MQDPDFSFGPRHRLVTSTRPFSWTRAVLTVIVGVTLGMMMLLACGVVHAETQKAQYERLNDDCRGKGIDVACDKRDALAKQMEASGVCYNPHSANEAQAWVRCTPPPRVENPGDLQMRACQVGGRIIGDIATMRDQGSTPQQAYSVALQSAKAAGLDTGPFQSIIWQVYAERGATQPQQLAYEAVYSCKRAHGLL